ncbi:MAG: cytochrome ubiquinol oxidase subunit I, partial [Hydrogenophaga sp.]
MEGIWETQRGAPLTLFGIPDEQERTTHFAIEIPKMASLILKHDLDGEIQGLNAFEGAHPPVAPIFYAFRVMVGVGTLMLLVASFTAWRLWKQRQAALVALPRPLLWVLSGMAFSGWVATLSGWYVTEIGRQPYLVYGLMRTSEAATTVPPPYIALTLTAYLVVYGLLLVTYVGVLKYMAENPKQHAPQAPSGTVLGRAGA